MNKINEIDETIERKETETYYQDHPELVVLSDRLYGKVTYAEYFDAYYLQFGDNVYYFPQKDSYQEGRNWKKKKFDSYEECLNFSQQHNIKIVMKSTVKSPFSNGLPDSRFLFPKRNTPYNPSERTDISRIRENKHNTNMNRKPLIRLTESGLHKIVKESVQNIINEIGDTPRGQRALGAVAARSIHRMHNALDDDQPEEAAYWDNVANDAARIGHNNVNPDWDEETEYFDDGVDYWYDNLRQYESKNVKKDLIRLTEGDLHNIVKESVNRIVKEGFDEGMGVASMLADKIEDVLTQSGLDYDRSQNGFNVYPSDGTIVAVKIYKEGNIPYSRR